MCIIGTGIITMPMLVSIAPQYSHSTQDISIIIPVGLQWHCQKEQSLSQAVVCLQHYLSLVLPCRLLNILYCDCGIVHQWRIDPPQIKPIEMLHCTAVKHRVSPTLLYHCYYLFKLQKSIHTPKTLTATISLSPAAAIIPVGLTHSPIVLLAISLQSHNSKKVCSCNQHGRPSMLLEGTI